MKLSEDEIEFRFTDMMQAIEAECVVTSAHLQWKMDEDTIELRNCVYEALKALYDEFCMTSEAIENHLLYELRQRRERE